MTKRNFEQWEKEFWGMNPEREDVAIVIRGGYVLVEYSTRSKPPNVPFWFPTRMVQPPDPLFARVSPQATDVSNEAKEK